MKRSEMLQILIDRLERIRIEDETFDSHYFAFCMLDEVMEAGMLPPSYVYWNAPRPYLFLEGKTVPEGLQQSMDNGDDLNKWEPENE